MEREINTQPTPLLGYGIFTFTKVKATVVYLYGLLMRFFIFEPLWAIGLVKPVSIIIMLVFLHKLTDWTL